MDKNTWDKFTLIVKLKDKPIYCEHKPPHEKREDEKANAAIDEDIRAYIITIIKLKEITIIINNKNEDLIINPYKLNLKDISFF